MRTLLLFSYYYHMLFAHVLTYQSHSVERIHKSVALAALIAMLFSFLPLGGLQFANADYVVESVLFSDGFESGDWETAWYHAGDEWDVTEGDAFEGDYKIEIIGSSGVANGRNLIGTATTTGYQNIKFNYAYNITSKLENDDVVEVQWGLSSGSTGWSTLKTYEDATGAVTDGWIEDSVDLPAGAEDQEQIFFRFHVELNGSGGIFQVDAGELTGEQTISTYSISGYKFEDADGEGELNINEPLNDWSITLFDSEGVEISTVSTGNGEWEDGYYEFEVEAGTYSICENPNDSWLQTYPYADLTTGDDAISVLDCSALVSSGLGYEVVVSDEPLEDIDFGNFQLGAISGYKYDEATDENHTVSGWNIYLIDADNEIHATTTNELGLYTFTDLGPGEYEVCEATTATTTGTSTVTNICEAHGLQTSPDPETEISHTVTITSGVGIGDIDVELYDFVNTLEDSITVFKFFDVNGNGEQDDGEEPLSGWEFCLYEDLGEGGVDHGCLTTDENGEATWNELAEGDYVVTETTQDGWSVTTGDLSGVENVTLYSGELVVIFGNTQNAIRVTKFWDMDESQDFTDGDMLLPGWEMCLYEGEKLDGDSTIVFEDGFESGDFTAWTSAGTKWSVKNADSPHTGTKHAIVVGSTSSSILQITTSTETTEDVSLSYWYKADLETGGSDDFVYVEWYDGADWNLIHTHTGEDIDTWTEISHILPSSASGNPDFAVRFDGDITAANDTFELDDVEIGGTEIASTPLVCGDTDQSGEVYWNFAELELVPGLYTVTEEARSEWWSTTHNELLEEEVTVSLGEVGVTFGNTTETVDLTGSKFHDWNFDSYWDGVHGASEVQEPGIEGWTIVATPITGELGEEDTEGSRAEKETWTDESGDYTFTFKAEEEGWWRIQEVPQDGWIQTYPQVIEDGDLNYYEVYITTEHEEEEPDFQEFSDDDYEAGYDMDEGLYEYYDFGNWEQPIIELFKFEDLNQDTTQDEGENGVGGFLFGLGQQTNEASEGQIPIEIVALGLTGPDGFAHIPVPFPGQFVLFEAQHDDWVPMFPNAREDTLVVGTLPQQVPLFVDPFFGIEDTLPGQLNPQFQVDSFFDIFVDATITDSELNRDPIQVDSFFDIFTEIATDGGNFQVDSFFDIFVDTTTQPSFETDSFFDIFVDASAFGQTITEGFGEVDSEEVEQVGEPLLFGNYYDEPEEPEEETPSTPSSGAGGNGPISGTFGTGGSAGGGGDTGGTGTGTGSTGTTGGSGTSGTGTGGNGPTSGGGTQSTGPISVGGGSTTIAANTTATGGTEITIDNGEGDQVTLTSEGGDPNDQLAAAAASGLFGDVPEWLWILLLVLLLMGAAGFYFWDRIRAMLE